MNKKKIASQRKGKGWGRRTISMVGMDAWISLVDKCALVLFLCRPRGIGMDEWWARPSLTG